ncbi:MAG: IMP dehydrogenase [Thermodesulfobacteriota bacterium]
MQELIPEGLTFDDVLLLPTRSEIIPKEVDITTWFTRDIKLNTPIVSAAMDTVTEAHTAISMAQAGGIGVIHRNMSIKEQVAEVGRVKKSESGMIADPITMEPDQRVYQALEIMSRFRISGVPIVRSTKLVGILTNRDLRFEKRLNIPVSEVMTKENLITVPEGITLEEAKDILHKNRIEKLLVVDEQVNLKGLITIKDIEKARKYPFSCKDELGRLRVAAAVGVTPETYERVEALLAAGADAIVIDAAHGQAKGVLEMAQGLRKSFSNCQLVAGNVATADGAKDLADLGVDAIKVGFGPGSICTTRVIAGVGVPQITAIQECASRTAEYGIPMIADGGVKYSGDITKALAAGASSVMIGSLFAGTDEAPGELVLYQGRTYKLYRGMGSVEAMKRGGRDRYMQGPGESLEELIPEGVEGRVPYRGSLAASLVQLAGGLRAGMGYVGCRDLTELRSRTRFLRISPAGLREGHVHDVTITKEAPNYWLEPMED